MFRVSKASPLLTQVLSQSQFQIKVKHPKVVKEYNPHFPMKKNEGVKAASFSEEKRKRTVFRSYGKF